MTSSVRDELMFIDDVAELLSLSKKGTLSLIARGFLLAFENEDGELFLPLFQFDLSGDHALMNLRYILVVSEFPFAVDRWAVYTWFLSDRGDLDGLSPCEWIDSGRDLKRLIDWAKLFVDTWTSGVVH